MRAQLTAILWIGVYCFSACGDSQNEQDLFAPAFTHNNHAHELVNTGSINQGSINKGSIKGDQSITSYPVLTFNADGTDNISQPLYSGDTLLIEYDAQRLTQCRGVDEHGAPHWQLFGFYQIDDHPPQPLPYTRFTLTIPSGQYLYLWFEMNDRSGCVELDDNHGQRYEFKIHPIRPLSGESLSEESLLGEPTPPISTISFNADQTIMQKGSLVSGHKARIHYELNRLAQCQTTQNDRPQWGIIGYISTEETEEESFQLILDEQTSSSVTEIIIPQGHELRLRFQATNRYGCLEEDHGAAFILD